LNQAATEMWRLPYTILTDVGVSRAADGMIREELGLD
jgi:hypothetical protein